MTTTQQEEVLSLPMPYKQAFAAVQAAYNKIGRVQGVQEKFGRIDGSINGGFLNLNKTGVTVGVQADGDSASKITISATTIEGIIFLNIAGKAISRLLEAI